MKVFLMLFLLILLWILYHVWKYRNPYKLIMVFGKKGSGKSTLQAKLSLQYNRKGWKVFCSTPGIPGTYYFDTSQVGITSFPPNSVILVDEVGMVWDNRDFKNFKSYTRDYFKLQRHYRNIVYLFSQSFDVDKKIRDLTDQMYLTKNFFNCFSLARSIDKKITIVHANEGQGVSTLADDMDFTPLWLFWCGSIKITYIPKYVKYFNSYDVPELSPATYDYTPIPPVPTFRERMSLLLLAVIPRLLRTADHARKMRLRLPVRRKKK